MNAEKYTQKSLEAVKAAQELTIQNQNQQIEQVHLLAALLRQDGGLVPQLLKKMGTRILQKMYIMHSLMSMVLTASIHLVLFSMQLD